MHTRFLGADEAAIAAWRRSWAWPRHGSAAVPSRAASRAFCRSAPPLLSLPAEPTSPDGVAPAWARPVSPEAAPPIFQVGGDAAASPPPSVAARSALQALARFQALG